MKTVDVIASAISNTFRSKTRTILTILAIFIGAFTLTITTGLGTGINQYIDETVAEIGADDVMTVTHAPAEDAGDGPQEYTADQVTQQAVGPEGEQSLQPITQADLDEIAAIDGVLSVEPVKQIDADYIQHADGARYRINVGSFVPGMQVQLGAGEQPDATSDALQVAIPVDYVAPLGFDDDAAAIGQEVILGLTDGNGEVQTVTATIVGVSEAGLGGAGASASPNTALTDALYEAQAIGTPAGQADQYGSATVRFDPDSTPEQVEALRASLADAGFESTTLDDTLGTFKTVIDGIVLVLNAFAIIALLAASFGIVNTLFMSVQERTREIGLMKAMGMGSGKVFGLFSSEATYIGLLGSVVGIGVGMLAGTAVGGALSSTLLADLPGLTLIAFDPLSILTIVVLVMGIAFVAGSLPAARAARLNPIDALRYE
ncbi:ABC transporter permease [Agromyces sp. SYSU K20354]|uniref:ABC transporter permease n=1 Tax=Agromyces cavernae TaxID=2898659 RepID=UPI001E39468B|nr:ABC transporter permease [Agromyces cavernae]MCD2441185.1 ABC transporter permease [Agromyces cavernae]